MMIKILLCVFVWIVFAEIIRFLALTEPTIYTVEPIGNDKSRYFLFAGMMNQPDKAFCFMDDLQGELNYVMYSNFGFSPNLMAKGVSCYINELESDEMPILIGISLGDQVVAELLDDNVMGFLPEKKVYAINPCTGKEFLVEEEAKKISWARVPLRGFAILLGPLSFIPIIPSDGGFMSFRLLADQIYYLGSPMKLSFKNTRDGVILSTEDEYLDNSTIMQKFSGAKIEFVDCKHGRTMDRMDLYRVAFDKIREQ